MLLTLRTPCISEKMVLKIKINLYFYFHTFCGSSKGFMKAFKVFIKTFAAPERNVKIKILSQFFLFIRDRDEKGSL